MSTPLLARTLRRVCLTGLVCASVAALGGIAFERARLGPEDADALARAERSVRAEIAGVTQALQDIADVRRPRAGAVRYRRGRSCRFPAAPGSCGSGARRANRRRLCRHCLSAERRAAPGVERRAFRNSGRADRRARGVLRRAGPTRPSAHLHQAGPRSRTRTSRRGDCGRACRVIVGGNPHAFTRRGHALVADARSRDGSTLQPRESCERIRGRVALRTTSSGRPRQFAGYPADAGPVARQHLGSCALDPGTHACRVGAARDAPTERGRTIVRLSDGDRRCHRHAGRHAGPVVVCADGHMDRSDISHGRTRVRVFAHC